MSNAAANPASGASNALNRTVAIGVSVFSLIEAVIAYFMVINPLYVYPIYHDKYLDEEGKTYIVKFFGSIFASEAEKKANDVIITFAGAFINIVLVYLVITVVPIVLSFFYYKGFAFAKTYLIGLFGLKAIIGATPMLMPLANVTTRIKIFGVADAVICLGLCVLFTYFDSVEYADDMLFTPEETKKMFSRGMSSVAMFVMMAIIAFAEVYALAGCGNAGSSMYLGWPGRINKIMTGIGPTLQGVSLVLLLSVALLAAIMYVREGEWACHFFFAFGAAVGITNIYAMFNKVMWVFKTYKPNKALANSGDEEMIEWVKANGMGKTWWIRTVCIGVCLVFGIALAIFAFTKIRSTIFAKAVTDEDKKASVAVLIGAASIAASFIFTVAGLGMWDRLQYNFRLGAMDYMYFIIYGGASLLLVSLLLGGYGSAKFGTLGLYVVVAANDFQNIFTVLSARSAVKANLAAEGKSFVGYNYIIASVMLILALLSCVAIIAVFIVKEVETYLYHKRYS